jgi:hypothetical protein
VCQFGRIRTIKVTIIGQTSGNYSVSSLTVYNALFLAGGPGKMEVIEIELRDNKIYRMIDIYHFSKW